MILDDTVSTPKKSNNIWVDIGPVVVFMVVYNLARRFAADDAIYIGTGVFMVATVLALAYAWIKERRVPGMLIVTASVVLVFGGLTLYLQDPNFIKMKPTMIYLLFSYALLGSAAFGFNILQRPLGHILKLPEDDWHRLAIRFGLFFQFLAVLNEYIWRNYSEAFWVNFKLFGFIPLTLGFTILQIMLVAGNSLTDEDSTSSP
jgi:intracellular septation protein